MSECFSFLSVTCHQYPVFILIYQLVTHIVSVQNITKQIAKLHSFIHLFSVDLLQDMEIVIL
jgi:hypothetical protein